MIRIKIDKKTTFLPLAKSKGTTPQRLEKAREANVQFLKSLKYEFVDREIKPAVFKRNLKQFVDRVGIKIEAVETPQDAFVFNQLRPKKINKGYLLGLPQDYWGKKIQQAHLTICAKQTQKLFNNIFNPKFSTREINMFNKNQDTKGAKKFFDKNITGTNVLKAKSLDKFLEKKPADEQINTLQALRYNVLAEQNSKIAEEQTDRQIGKMENMRFSGKSYDLSEQKYDKKMQILNNKLAQVIKSERQKHAESLVK